MKRPPTARAVGRPRDLAKGLAILDAGWQLFLERGVEATPIEMIAAKAGVSKVTLYTHYKDKTALFRAAVRREMERIEAAQQSGDGRTDGRPVAERLYGFGLGLMAFLASKPAVDFYNVMAGELRRHDELARAFYDLGPGQTRTSLAALISEAATRGELAVPDPVHAAEELFGLWQGFTNFQYSLGVEIDVIKDDLPQRIDRGVRLFMRLYGPTRERS